MRWAGVLAALVLVAATTATFRAVSTHDFLNWDDPDVVAAIPHLEQPIGPLVSWAVSTRHMGHYQPLSWLALATAAGSPASAQRVHTASVALHTLNAVLLLVLIAQLLDHGSVGAGAGRWWAALGAAALFAVHPLRLEPVAWASALPYLLSYGPLIAALMCWVLWARHGTSRSYWAAVALFAVSQLFRVTAPLLPLALGPIALAIPGAPARATGALVRAVVPFAAVALPLALVEAGARSAETLADIGPGPRAAWALTHPAAYLWRLVAPGSLNPLDALPRVAVANWDIAVVAVVVAALVASVSVWLWGRRVTTAVWGSYLLLLLPVVGVLPSGLQLTADRYTYGPSLVLTAALGVALGRLSHPTARGLALMAAGGAAVLLGQSAQAQVSHWRDSVSLWSRAIALEPNNDVALYNLALAEIAADRPAAAIDHLQRLVALVPDHGPGKEALNALVADREVAAAEANAAAGRFFEAIGAYNRALGADPGSVRARLGRGMAAMETGQLARAADDLAAAVAAGRDDPAIIATLAYAWTVLSRGSDAMTLLSRGVERHPTDIGLASNLARLLVTIEPASLRDPAQALALAARANDLSGGNDPRVLDTLALALAATGRRTEAAEALTAAVALARDAGDEDLAATLTARRASLR